MDLSPGGMRKLKEVHRSERELDLPGADGPGERQVPGVSWGSLALSLTERLTPHLCLSSEICQEQNFHLALDARQDEAGPASRFGSRQLALCRDNPPPPTRRASLSYLGVG